jgi:hypothetical protein
MIRPPWDFEYRPIHAEPTDDGDTLDDFILASEGPVDPAKLTNLLGQLAPGLRVVPVLDWHPLYWTRVCCTLGIDRLACERRLQAAGVAVRYVAAARAGSQRMPPALDLATCLPMRASHWRSRGPSLLDERRSPGRWFVGATGVEVDRRVCGTGAGTRLAVIDDDAGEVDRLDLDQGVLVGSDLVSTASSHAAHLVAWAVGARRRQGETGGDYVGVAPDASPRLYWIPKPGHGVFQFPLAIVRAVADGADVILCATNVDGQWSPMLDDALELASRLGRRGQGTPVILPCGRETSSPEGSVHSSLSLGTGEPASDPRVFCVGPSGHDGGWFLWRDRRGRLHPFANRGPALRWLAPGDDVALPFRSAEIMGHAESSGASAIAAGVLLLVIGKNPQLTLPELEAALSSTVCEIDTTSERRGLADPYDLLPVGRDRDGHNAKHGYGRLHATRACLFVSDPVAFALVSIGEDQAALRWLELRNEVPELNELYSRELAEWATRALLADATQRQASCALARLLRLLAVRPERLRDQTPGAMLRQAMMLLRELPRGRQAPALDGPLSRELATLVERARASSLDRGATRDLEQRMCSLAEALWPTGDSQAVAHREESLTPPVALLGA